jgi:hypothetical protein
MIDRRAAVNLELISNGMRHVFVDYDCFCLTACLFSVETKRKACSEPSISRKRFVALNNLFIK